MEELNLRIGPACYIVYIQGGVKEIDIKSYNNLEAQVVAFTENKDYKLPAYEKQKEYSQLFLSAFILNDRQSMHNLIEKGLIGVQLLRAARAKVSKWLRVSEPRYLFHQVR